MRFKRGPERFGGSFGEENARTCSVSVGFQFHERMLARLFGGAPQSSIASYLNTSRIEPNLDVIGPIRSTRASIVLPLRYPPRSPRRPRCLHSLFKVRKVAFDERPKSAEHLLELLRGGCVVLLLRLSGRRR